MLVNNVNLDIVNNQVFIYTPIKKEHADKIVEYLIAEKFLIGPQIKVVLREKYSYE